MAMDLLELKLLLDNNRNSSVETNAENKDQSVGMVKWKDSTPDVCGPKCVLVSLINLQDVGNNIVMGQFHPLGPS